MKFFRLSLLLHLLTFTFAYAYEPKVTQVELSSLDDKTVFYGSNNVLMLANNLLLYSNNSGKTWSSANGIDTDDKVIKIERDMFFNNRAFAQGNNGLYMTKDQGENWEQLNFFNHTLGSVDMFVQTHPTKEDYILIQVKPIYLSGFVGSFASQATGGMLGITQVGGTASFVSFDGGKLFTKITHPTSSSDTSFDCYECLFTRFSKDSHVGDESDFLCWFTKSSNSLFLEPYEGTVLYVFKDFGKTLTAVEQFNSSTLHSMKLLNNHIAVFTNGSSEENQGFKMWVSKSGSEFHEAKLPDGFNLSTIKILPGSRERLIISADKIKQKKQTVEYEMLISDSIGIKFSKLSLLPKKYGSPSTDTAVYSDGAIISTFINGENEETKISTDNGLSWSNLRAENGEKNKPYECDIDGAGQCSLTLDYGQTQIPGKSLFTNTTLGNLIVLGCVPKKDDLSSLLKETYISRNGGNSWSKILDFAVIYAFGDMGNIIVAISAPHYSLSDETGELYYSLDNGYTWSTYQLNRRVNPIDLFALIGDGSDSVFILTSYYQDSEDDSDGYAIYTIDFSNAFDGRICSEDDFEDWYQGNGECFNGARYKLNQRKPEAQCLRKKSVADVKKVEEPCDCSEKDYECTFEFSKNNKGKCALNKSLLKLSNKCSGSKKSIKLTPSTLTLQNKCQNPLNIKDVKVRCNNKR